MIKKAIEQDNVKHAAKEILEDYLSNTTDTSYNRGGENIIYFDGWDGLGASAVLAAVAESARYKFDVVIHVDCSLWESRREMQRRIAEELKLDKSAMALFDKEDEEDDFRGIDKSSRAEIASVAKHIFHIVKDRTCLMIFHNGSDHDIISAASGIPVFDWRNKVLWTFRGRFRLDPAIRDKVKSAHVFLSATHNWHWYRDAQKDIRRWSRDDVLYLVHEEVAQVIQDIDQTVITDCWFYLSHLHNQHDKWIDFDGDCHAANYWVCDGIIPGDNYWVCDGIIPGDNAWEVGNRLHEAMRLEYLPTKPNHSEWFSKFSDLQDKNTRWVSITSKSVQMPNIQTIPKETTSYFLTLENSDHLTPLPKHLFEQASNLRVLRLSWCAFSFASPPFICCSNLRFIFIDNCRDEDDHKQETEWAFLKRLWVLDIRHTSWDWILSPSKMVLMTQLRELNLKSAGVSRCVWGMATLQLTWLCNLRKLRVIDSSTFLRAIVQDSFMGMEKLELLDLSGNSDMEVLPNLSAASILKVLILDGCDGLQHVEPDALSASLESFSFDGSGPATKWKNSLQIPEKQARFHGARSNQELPKVSKISLEGCARLKNVFLCRLPNLKELNLSETSIEALDLEAMQVRQLERLFLIGCENLCRVQWLDATNPPLKLLCVDTRGKVARSVDGDCQRSHSYSQPNLSHVVATDARFLRGFSVFPRNFHLHLSSTVSSRQLPGRKETEICSSDELGLVPATGSSFPYVDVLDKVVKEEDKDEDSLMQACTQLQPSERHIEFAKGGRNWKIEGNAQKYIASMMDNAQSLHVHDNSSIPTANLQIQVYQRQFTNLRWCRVERCPNLHTAFVVLGYYLTSRSFGSLETLWASDLLRAHCIWSRYLRFDTFGTTAAPAGFSQLRHIHLHSCPRLVFVLPLSFPTLASLETIHVTHCGELKQIFPKGRTFEGAVVTNIEFPSLRNIHLHELPMLKDICETNMSAPALETIKLRGCCCLRRLPAIHAGRAHDKPPAVVDCEKDWWDKLQWDGLEASRRLFTPLHSRYYKKTTPRGSLLR